jgi:hypothetical protein
MSVPGQLRHFGRRPTTSGLPLETDIGTAGRHVSNVPIAEITFLRVRLGSNVGQSIDGAPDGRGIDLQG